MKQRKRKAKTVRVPGHLRKVKGSSKRIHVKAYTRKK